MAQCKNCIHYCVCNPFTAPNESYPEVDGCKLFKNADENGLIVDEKLIENSINELIAEAVKGGGHVYVVDRQRNAFALRLTESISIQFFGGYKGGSENGGKQ